MHQISTAEENIGENAFALELPVNCKRVTVNTEEVLKNIVINYEEPTCLTNFHVHRLKMEEYGVIDKIADWGKVHVYSGNNFNLKIDYQPNYQHHLYHSLPSPQI